jgi:hypothetical protein
MLCSVEEALEVLQKDTEDMWDEALKKFCVEKLRPLINKKLEVAGEKLRYWGDWTIEDIGFVPAHDGTVRLFDIQLVFRGSEDLPVGALVPTRVSRIVTLHRQELYACLEYSTAE